LVFHLIWNAAFTQIVRKKFLNFMGKLFVKGKYYACSTIFLKKYRFFFCEIILHIFSWKNDAFFYQRNASKKILHKFWWVFVACNCQHISCTCISQKYVESIHILFCFFSYFRVKKKHFHPKKSKTNLFVEHSNKSKKKFAFKQSNFTMSVQFLIMWQCSMQLMKTGKFIASKWQAHIQHAYRSAIIRSLCDHVGIFSWQNCHTRLQNK